MNSDSPGSVTAGATVGRVPDFFIVGHPKSGTTALHRMLVSHPEIYMPIKEPRFFAPELRSRFRVIPSRLPSTFSGYLSLFAGAGPEQRVGEATPSYLRSHDAAARIAAVAPDARIVALFREPASFLRSFHLQSVHNHVETERNFGKAMALEPLRRQGRRIPLLSQSPQTLLYSDHVRYTAQLRRFHAHFPPEQVLVLIYEDYRRDNEATVRRVRRFLGVDDTLVVATSKTAPLPGIRSLSLHQLTRGVDLVQVRLPNGRARLMAHKASRARRVWRRLVYTDAPPVDERVMLELRRRYRDEVVEFSRYLDRDLVSLWGYESVI